VEEDDEDPVPEDGGAWTLAAAVEHFAPQPIGPVMGGRYLGLRAAACGEACHVLVGSSGDVWEWRKPLQMAGHPVRLPSLCNKHVTQVACGAHHTMALSALDQVWGAWHSSVGERRPCSSAFFLNPVMEVVGCTLMLLLSLLFASACFLRVCCLLLADTYC
jgi:hypothetical protein